MEKTFKKSLWLIIRYDLEENIIDEVEITDKEIHIFDILQHLNSSCDGWSGWEDQNGQEIFDDEEDNELVLYYYYQEHEDSDRECLFCARATRIKPNIKIKECENEGKNNKAKL